MTTIAINPMVVSVSPTNATPIHSIQPTEHGGGAKKLVAVVAAVAIPFAAPAIASAIGLSGAIAAAGASATIASVAGSAIVGAGLGAISAKVTGGDVKTSAIFGAIGGGIGGYTYAQNPANAAQISGQTGSQTSATLADGTSSLTGGADAGTTLSGGTDQLALEPGAGGGSNLTNASYTPAQSGDVAAQLSNTGNAQVVNASLPGSTVAQGGQTLVQSGAGAGTQVGTYASQLPPDASFGAKFVAGVKDSGSVLASKLTSPDAIANVTLQAGGQLLGMALAPDPEMPPEQKELLEMRKQELAQLKEKDEAAFNAQMDAAKQYLQQAKQYDPTYMAFQAANKEAIEQQRKLREQYRRAGLSRGRNISEAEKRRMSLDAARSVSSEYDRGFQTGLTAQNRTTQAGLSAIPSSARFANYISGLKSLEDDTSSAMAAARARSSGAAKNISDLFAGFNVKAGNTAAAQNQMAGLKKDAVSGLPDGSDKDEENNIPDSVKPFYQPDGFYQV
jgi:hypothetical protein